MVEGEELGELIRRLRREGRSRRQIMEELGIGNSTLSQHLGGEPPPEWTKRPRAKDELRAQARELRLEAHSVPQIAVKLGVAKSSVSLWVRDMPKPLGSRAALAKQKADEWHGKQRRLRQDERQKELSAAASEVGLLTDRELLLLGVVAYWAEGAKSKPWRRGEALYFTNSDPDMIRLFLRWLDMLGVERDQRRYRLMIHESADVTAAERFWSDVVNEEPSAFSSTVLKRHRPKTTRKNTGDGYVGCLRVYVLGSAALYRRMEGHWRGIAEAVALLHGGE